MILKFCLRREFRRLQTCNFLLTSVKIECIFAYGVDEISGNNNSADFFCSVNWLAEYSG